MISFPVNSLLKGSHQRCCNFFECCFSVNFAKFLRTRFSQNTSGRLLLFVHDVKWAHDGLIYHFLSPFKNSLSVFVRFRKFLRYGRCISMHYLRTASSFLFLLSIRGLHSNFFGIISAPVFMVSVSIQCIF